jgi:hypothetical protein
VYSGLKNNASKRGIEFTSTKEEFIQWWTTTDRRCTYCGILEKDLSRTWPNIRNAHGRLSVERLDGGKGYQLDNIALACYICNTIRNEFFTAEEMETTLAPVLRQLVERRLHPSREI